MPRRKRTPEELALLKQLEPNKIAIPDEPDNDPVEIDVTNIPVIEEKKESLKEKLLGKLKPEQPVSKKTQKKATGKNAEKTVTVFRTLLPMSLAGLMALQFKRLFRTPYEPVAPTRDEIAEVLLPIFNLISRYVEISGTISQNAEDIGAALIASITLMLRMLMTAQEIRSYGQQLSPTERAEEYAKRAATEHELQPVNNNHNGGAPSPDRVQPGNGAYGHYYGENVTLDGRVWTTIPTGDDATANGDVDDDAWRRAKVADLLHRDTLGRRQMGLAPRIIREGD